MKINEFFPKIILFAVLLLASNFLLEAMDPPGLIFVKTNDEKMVAIEEWMVPEMKTLLVLLEHQRGKNSSNNPIDASMINEKELILLTDALNAMKKDILDEFFENLAYKRGVNINIREIGQGKIRKLIIAAEKVNALRLNTFITSYFLPFEDEERIKKQIVKNITPLLRQEMIKKSLKVFPRPAGSISSNLGFFCCNNQKIILPTRSGFKICNIDNPLKCLEVQDSANTDISILDYSEKTSKMLVGFKINDIVSARLLNFQNVDQANVHQAIVQNLNLNADILPKVGSFNDHGDKVVIGCNSPADNLFICDTNTGDVLHNLKGHSDPVVYAEFNQKGDKIISYSDGLRNNLILWDAENGKKIFSLDGHHAKIRSAEFSSNGGLLMTCDSANKLKLWDIKTGKEVYNRDSDRIYSVNFNAKGDKIYIKRHRPDNHILLVLNISNLQKIEEFSLQASYNLILDLKKDRIITIKWNNDRSNRLLTFWDVSDFSAKKSINISQYELIDDGSFSPDGNKLILYDETKEKCFILDSSNFEKPIKIIHEKLHYPSIFWSKDSSWACVTGTDNNFIVKTDLSQEDKKNIAKIIELPLAQVRLINQMALAKSRGKKELSFTNKDLKLYYALPPEIKEFLPQTLCPRSLTEKELMGEPKMGNECAIF